MRKVFFGWLGGLFLFSSAVGFGLFITRSAPVDFGHNLSIDFLSLRKLEYFAKSEKEFSSPIMDVSELSAKMESSMETASIKISSLHEPFSDVGKKNLSYFITSENDTNPYILLSPTVFSRNYLSVVFQLSKTSLKIPKEPDLITLKVNGVDRQPYYKIFLPPNDDLDSILLADAIKDPEFKSFAPAWQKVIEQAPGLDSLSWSTQVLVYYSKNSDQILISHFLPVSLREFYE